MGNKSGVRIRSESSIEIDFYYRNVRCRERVKLAPTPKNLTYCRKLKASIEIEIAKGQFEYEEHFPESPRAKFFSKMPGDALLIQDYLESWLATEKENIKHSTMVGYTKILKYHLVPVFGKMLLTELRRKHLRDWAATHLDMSAKRMRNVLSPLRVALNAAVEGELIESNPLIGFKVRKRFGRKAEDVDPFSADERAAILSALDRQAHYFVQFAFWTGLRTSELVALDWPDIDWMRGVVVVSRAMTEGMDEPEDGTKTDAGMREVKLLPPALEALKAQKAFTFLKSAEVFQNPRTGERWTGDRTIREGMWIPALKKAGVRYRKPYQTRHTFASMMLMAGENPMWVAKQMGHTDWSLTAKRYARWIPSDMPDAGNKAVERWSHFGHNVTASH